MCHIKPWKSRTVAVLVSTLLINISGTAGASGIPVVDGASIADRALKHVESMAKYAEQIAVMKNQLDSQRRHLESITGTRSLGDILNNPMIRNALPDDARELLRSVNASGGDIGDILKRIEREEQLTGNYQVDRRNLDTRAENLALRSQALMTQTQKSMTARMAQVSHLQSQINLTQDAKAIADLQARLLVEQVNVQVDQSRADVLQRQISAEQMLMEAQAEKLAASAFSIDAIRAPLPRGR